MLEYIFRNINDIRVFDVFYVECPFTNDSLDIDDVLDYLEYGYSERIQIEDSIEHLVKNKVLDVVYEKAKSWSGCKVCKYLDKLKIPRFGSHKQHKIYEEIEVDVPFYRIASNEFINHLFTALFQHIYMMAEDDIYGK